MSTWLQIANSSFSSLGKQWQTWQTMAQSGSQGSKNRVTGESIASLLKTWRMVSSTFNSPGVFPSGLDNFNDLPGSLLNFAKTNVEGFSRFQQQLLDKVKKTGKDEPFKFDVFDEHLFSGWKDLYENEFRQYLNIPQLGLNRFYQEKVNEMVDKYNLLQTTMAEFLAILFQPMERSFKALQDTYVELAEKGELSDNAKDYYQIWIRLLEKDYTSLFKSPQYLAALTKSTKSLADFKAKRDEIIQDMLTDFPIPTERDLDELYKEIYQLKKRIRDLEKERKTASRQTEKG